MVSVHGFVEAAQHAVEVGTDSNAVKKCSQTIMPNAQSKFYNCLFFLASLVFWLILASVVFEIALSLILVCTHFGALVLSVD